LNNFTTTLAGVNGHGVYGLTGVCSTATAEGLQAAGLQMNADLFPTPQSISSDQHLGYVGTYNTFDQRSELPSWNLEIR
jgi:hypothetical protein